MRCAREQIVNQRCFSDEHPTTAASWQEQVVIDVQNLVGVKKAVFDQSRFGCIFPENEPSISAHLRAGFREVGRRERIARFHDGRWRDTVVLERRSRAVGTG